MKFGNFECSHFWSESMQVQMIVNHLNPCFSLSTEVAMIQKRHHNCEGGLVEVDRGLSSQRIFPSHAQNFLEFWKSPADLAIIPQVNLKKNKTQKYKQIHEYTIKNSSQKSSINFNKMKRLLLVETSLSLACALRMCFNLCYVASEYRL